MKTHICEHIHVYEHRQAHVKWAWGSNMVWHYTVRFHLHLKCLCLSQFFWIDFDFLKYCIWILFILITEFLLQPLNSVPEVSKTLARLPLIPALQVKRPLQGRESNLLGQMLLGWSNKLGVENWPLGLATWESLVTLTTVVSVKYRRVKSWLDQIQDC